MPLSEALTVIQRERNWRKNNAPYEFFEPNAKSEEFIKIVAAADSYPIVFSAANGVSKTSTVVNLIANLIWPGGSEWFDFDRFKNWPWTKRIRYITDPELVKDSGPFRQEILKWFPKQGWRCEKAGKQYYSQYSANEWFIDVLTTDQEVRQFEGGTFGLIIMDEPTPQSIYSACVGRLRLGGLLLVVMTPLTSSAWFYDQIVPEIPQRIVYADIEDACIQHGIRGHLEHEHIVQMMNNWPPDEIEARAHGTAMSLKGVIFKTFDPKIHILKEDLRPPYGAQVKNVVDPHSDKPFASIWGFEDARKDIYIFDEWPNEDFYKMHNCQLTIKDYKQIFSDKEAGLTVTRRIIDRHFADTASAVNKRTLRQELQSIGLQYWPSYKAEQEIDTGIERVRRALAYNTSQPLSNLNQPKLYISPKCINTIKSLNRWSRDQETGKVREEYKDFCDTVRYLVMDSHENSTLAIDKKIKSKWGGHA